jgi:hypothetical protein
MFGNRRFALLSAVALIIVSASFSFGQKTGKNKYGPCDEQAGFRDKTFPVVIRVIPPDDKTWKYPEAPAVVADRFLETLNKNRNNVFTEADGVVPKFRMQVTLSDSTEGTRQISAVAVIRGLGQSDDLFSVTSGEAEFTSWTGAIDSLAKEVARWIAGGWTNKTPCVRRDGTLRHSTNDPPVYQ